MIPLAILAKVDFNPARLLKFQWVHDIAHTFLSARLRTEKRFDELNRSTQRRAL
jgi:hypothetical protein